MEIKYQDKVIQLEAQLPLLPLRDVVVFPTMIHPLLVGRPSSVAAVEESMLRDRVLIVATQKNKDVDEPQHQDIHRTGTLIQITQLLRLPDGTMKILVEGISRVSVGEYVQGDDYFRVNYELIADETEVDKAEAEALLRTLQEKFRDYVGLNKRVPDGVLMSLDNADDPMLLADTIATHIPEKIELKQALLEEPSPISRMRILLRVITEEMEILQLERQIETEVKSQVQRNQREFYLNEQMKAIRRELGHDDDEANELDEMAGSIESAKMSKDGEEAALRELDRLAKMPPMSPEASVIRTYLETLLSLPWKKRSRDRLEIVKVAKKLDDDHHGLKKVKERILEYLSVLKLTRKGKKTGKMKGPILCFVGPPGVGKTSLGRSIADSMGRKFQRISLGGVRDEAEIRGHRRTYIGSMPGRILQSLKKAGTRNPVILLDEVDKLGMDFRGDPTSALLEVLDPEQNHTFSDHYLEVPFDLSEVFFITTANNLHEIPGALRDRLEIIRIPGYLQDEKRAIAKGFLIPKQVKAHGLTDEQLEIPDLVLDRIISEYTRESGVRNLEREVAALCRKTARQVVENEVAKVDVDSAMLEDWLGPPRFINAMMDKSDEVGMATGLAWTSVGGETLSIEVQLIPGKGEFILTGQLGDVMKESAKAAQTIVRVRADEWNIDPNCFTEQDVHIHVPEGAVPKDGPSAGVAMTTALVSAITGIAVRHDVAMTGEITLRGKVLAVGGLPEKTVAAQRLGMKTVLLPKQNEKDLPDLPDSVKEQINLVFVESIEEVLKAALVEMPGKKSGKSKKSASSRPSGRSGATTLPS